jgi:aspartate/methionine/tyrosine aminotransferase
MSQGAPAAPPSKVLLEALSHSSASPESSGYCDVIGESALRSAFAEEMKTVYGREIDVTQDDIAITAGCNLGFVATVMCLADPGDEIILPVPWYVCRLSFAVLTKRCWIGISITSTVAYSLSLLSFT